MNEHPTLDEVRDAIYAAALQVHRRAQSQNADWRDRMAADVSDYVGDIEDEVLPVVKRLLEGHP